MELSDSHHPVIQAKARELARGKSEVTDMVMGIFSFVRDEIRFGFPPVWDRVSASETMRYGMGYCNTKATLFHALCKAMDIPSRIHTGLIDIRIMQGIFPVFAFPFLPACGGHSWMEIRFSNGWKSIDSYINDKFFYEGALKQFNSINRNNAFSISNSKGPSSCEFNFGEKGFVHMGAVTEDQGTWDDYSTYMSSDKYLPMRPLQSLFYPLIASISNNNIERIRAGKGSGIC